MCRSSPPVSFRAVDRDDFTFYMLLTFDPLTTAGVFKLYLLKGHILMAQGFAGRIHALQSKVCILSQDTPTDISLHKHT
jgi:hypothetical protein